MTTSNTNDAPGGADPQLHMPIASISDRTKDEQTGNWVYANQSEACFAWEIGEMSGRLSNEKGADKYGRPIALFFDRIDLPSIDSFLEKDAPVICDSDRYESLLDLRRSALSAYRSSNFDLALSIMRELHRTCQHVGYMASAGPLAASAVKRQTAEKQFRQKGAAARRKFTQADRTAWREEAKLLTNIESKSGRAKVIATRFGLDSSAIETIRKELGNLSD